MKVDRLLLTTWVSLALTSAAFAGNETGDPIARAMAKAKPQKENMLLCYDVAAIKFAVQTCEPAETVVEAAYGACRGAEEDYVAAVMKNAPGLSRDGRDAVNDGLENGLEELKRRLRQVLLANALKARGDRCRQNSN
jgi:hypothetical protein